MKIKDIFGRERNVAIKKYLIDWDYKRASKFQYDVKQILRPFWKNCVVLEEFVIPSSRMRVDIINITKGIAVEVSGRQHETFVKHFHGGRAGFTAAWKSDMDKQNWIENIIKFKFIEIVPKDLPKLNRQWFIDTYKIDII